MGDMFSFRALQLKHNQMTERQFELWLILTSHNCNTKHEFKQELQKNSEEIKKWGYGEAANEAYRRFVGRDVPEDDDKGGAGEVRDLSNNHGGKGIDRGALDNEVQVPDQVEPEECGTAMLAVQLDLWGPSGTDGGVSEGKVWRQRD